MISKKIIFTKEYLFIVALGIICLLVYANSLYNGFVSDDIATILQNPQISVLRHVWFDPQKFINALIYHFFGDNVFCYHLASVTLHFINTVLVFLFLRLFFGPWTCFLTAALFTAHPLHTEAVTWISGRPHEISAFFALTAYLLYNRATSSSQRVQKASIAQYLLSVLLFAYSILGGLSFPDLFPAMLILSDVILKRRVKNWKLWLPFLAIVIVRVYFAKSEIASRFIYMISERPDHGIWRNPLHAFVYSVFLTFWLFVWPVKLTLYHEITAADYSWAFYPGVFLLLTMLCLLPYLFKRARIVFWAVLSFIFFLSPTYSPLLVTYELAERYTYLPSLFLCVILAFYYERLVQKPSEIRKNLLTAVFCIIITCFGVRTIARNADWKDTPTLFSAMLKTSPKSSRAHNNLAILYGQKGNIAKAVEELNIAIQNDSQNAEAYHNLGFYYGQMGKLQQALECYTTSIKINPYKAEAYFNRADVYQKINDFNRAMSDYDRAIKLNPQMGQAYFNRANLYIKQGDLSMAIRDFTQASALIPGNAGIYVNLAFSYFFAGQFDKSWECVYKAQKAGVSIEEEFLLDLKKASGRQR